MTDESPMRPGLSSWVPPLHAPFTPALKARLFVLSDSALKNGLHIVSGVGGGKSRLLGRLVSWQLLIRQRPCVILDPTGGIVSNLLDKLIRLPLEMRKPLWSRLVYVDVGARDYIVPSPLYYRLDEADTLFAIANRLPAVLKRQDPHLQSAPILGWNSLFECALFAGQIAAALGRQIDFVADLIAQPRVYKEALRQVLTTHPELSGAVNYFRELMDPNSASLREKRTGSFVNKLLPFLADPIMQATFAAARRGVDWAQVVQAGQTVLIDFQAEQDPERRQFKLLWWFRNFTEYVKRRGMAGRGAEVTLIIDEITQLLGHRTGEGHAVMAEDIEELVAVLGRNYGVNVVIAHQNLSQVDERIRNVLMGMGTQMLGLIDSPDDALYLARQFFHYDAHAVKKHEPVWMNLEQFDTGGLSLKVSAPQVIDYRTVEFTPEEQLLQAMERFRTMPKFHFLVRPALSEGAIGSRLQRVSMANLDRNQYPDEAQIAPLRALLRQKWGIPFARLCAEIEQRTPLAGLETAAAQADKAKPTAPASGILKGEEKSAHATPSHPVSTTTAQADPASAGEEVDPFWR